MSARIRFGPAGWDYRDWSARVYPRPTPPSRLGYLARYFDAIEVNSSFYRPTTRELSQGWVRQLGSAPDFRFSVKLWRGYTHTDAPLESASVDRLRAGLEPLERAGRLGALLAQFPWSFKPCTASLRRLERLLEAFQGLPLVVEFRHRGWDRDDVLALLRRHAVGFCNIDQPRLAGCLEPTRHLCSRLGYVRLHGRNAAAWFKRDAGRDERYDYLYTAEELAEWLAPIRRLAEASDELFVITNNHFQGSAVVNALELRHALEGRPLPVPPALLASYPRLARCADARSLSTPGVQRELFER